MDFLKYFKHYSCVVLYSKMFLKFLRRTVLEIKRKCKRQARKLVTSQSIVGNGEQTYDYKYNKSAAL